MSNKVGRVGNVRSSGDAQGAAKVGESFHTIIVSRVLYKYGRFGRVLKKNPLGKKAIRTL